MSCYFIQYVQGAKMMRPVQSKEEYLKLRDSDRQKWLVSEIRKGKKDGSKSKEEIGQDPVCPLFASCLGRGRKAYGL